MGGDGGADDIGTDTASQRDLNEMDLDLHHYTKASPRHKSLLLVIGLGSGIILVCGAVFLSAIIIAAVYNKRNANTALLMDCSFDLEGHRGARGLLPENTIMAYKAGIDHGVTTIEMDTCITKDLQVVMSHDPYLNPDFCLGPQGETIANESIAMTQYKIYEMEYETLAKCDCGINGNKNFPEQKKISAFKPTLSQVFTEIETYIRKNKQKRVMYNIETKTRKERDNIFHPAPEVFVDLLYDVIAKHKMQQRVIIESFDVRTLQLMRQKDPSIPLSLLVDKANNFDFRKKLKELGFPPEYYSPHYSLMNEEIMSYMRENKIKVVPWTPNTVDEIKQLLDLGVDGIITDYPNFSSVLPGCKKRRVPIK